jgi:hypothetical protein
MKCCQMRLLILAYLFGHNNANSFRYLSLVSALIAKGFIIDIVGYKKLPSEMSARIVNDQCKYYSVYDYIKLGNLPTLFYYTGLEFLKVFLNFRGHIRIRSGLFNGVIKMICRSLFKNNLYKCVIIGVPPWSLYELVPFFKRNAPVILDVSDPLYKYAAYDKMLKGMEASKKIEEKAFNMASKIVVMSEPMLELYKEFNLPDAKYVFIPPSTPCNSDHIANVYDYSADHVFSFLYAGMIYPGYRDLDSCIEAIDGMDRFNLEIITDRHYKGITFSNISISNWLKRDELYKRFKATDILVFVDNFFGYQVPSKINELLAIGKPILFIYDKRNTYLFDKLKNTPGIFFSVNKKESISTTIGKIVKSSHIYVNYKIQPEYKEDFVKDMFTKCINAV